MRGELNGRASTVFNAPTRDAVYSLDYDSAKLANLSVEGKSLSKQSFCITPKIKEVDQFVSLNSDLEVIEGHPEVCFKFLNESKIVQSKKSSKVGIEERLSILENYNQKAPDLYRKILAQTLRKNVQRDDIVDAICLAVTLELASDGLSYLTDENPRDEKGINIKIGYVDPYSF